MVVTWSILGLAFLVATSTVYVSARPYISNILATRRQIRDQREEAVVSSTEDMYRKNSEDWKRTEENPGVVVMASYEGQAHLNNFIADMVEWAGAERFAEALCFNLKQRGIVDFAWHQIRSIDSDQIRVPARAGRLNKDEARDVEGVLRGMNSGRRELESTLRILFPDMSLDFIMHNPAVSYHLMLDQIMGGYGEKGEDYSKKNNWRGHDEVMKEFAAAKGGPISRSVRRKAEDPRSLPGESGGLDGSPYPLGSVKRDGKVRIGAKIKAKFVEEKSARSETGGHWTTRGGRNEKGKAR